jgi:hypothetical protein
VDFVITYGGNRYLPIEVKHRKSDDKAPALKHFMKKYKLERRRRVKNQALNGHAP